MKPVLVILISFLFCVSCTTNSANTTQANSGATTTKRTPAANSLSCECTSGARCSSFARMNIMNLTVAKFNVEIGDEEFENAESLTYIPAARPPALTGSFYEATVKQMSQYEGVPPILLVHSSVFKDHKGKVNVQVHGQAPLSFNCVKD